MGLGISTAWVLIPSAPAEAQSVAGGGQACGGALGSQGNCQSGYVCSMGPSGTARYCAINGGCGWPGSNGKGIGERVTINGQMRYCAGPAQGFQSLRAAGESCSVDHACTSNNCAYSVGMKRCAPAGKTCVTPPLPQVAAMGMAQGDTRLHNGKYYRCQGGAYGLIEVRAAGQYCNALIECAQQMCEPPRTTLGATLVASNPTSYCQQAGLCISPNNGGEAVSDGLKRAIGGVEYRCVGSQRRWLKQKAAGETCTSNAECSSFNCNLTNTSQTVRRCQSTGPGNPSIGVASVPAAPPEPGTTG
ncbi:MAG: hypothetical protein KIT84_13655 [Labilithrix sp.]|nr:hypothetical protein [Labilithrix sp.]MCW5812064.1 hypothetical protein [Labilithrix sp.]